MSGASSMRVPPLAPAQWSPEAAEAFSALGGAASGASSNIVMIMAQHPALAKAYLTFGRHILLQSSLDDRTRELITLRVVSKFEWGAYEWHHHVRFAEQVGIGPDEIEATKRPLADSGFVGSDLAALRAVDELVTAHELSDAGWEALGEHFDLQQRMDLVFTIGLYVMSSLTKAAFRVPIEDHARSEKHPPASLGGGA